MSDFVRRHNMELCAKPAKETSPQRSSDVMDKLTKDFVDELDPLFQRNYINKNNLFVFDETVIRQSTRTVIVIGSARKSGGGNSNQYRRGGKTLGCYIPISKCDGTTPFRVFIMKGAENSKPAGPDGQPEENVRVEHTPTLYRLYLSSKSGYVTIPLFKCIMDHFSKWWNESFPGLDCYTICDGLRIHVNDDIVQFANSKGIHIKTIMPGSSHWFQVHDQLPFGQLKKNMILLKNKFSRVSFLGSKEHKEFMMGVFKVVESKAFAPRFVLKSFADTGLWPWNPKRPIELCEEHCPPPSELNGSPRMRKLERIMADMSAEQEAKRNKVISIGRRFMAGLSESGKRYQLREKKSERPQLSEDDLLHHFFLEDINDDQMQPPKKRARKSQGTQ